GCVFIVVYMLAVAAVASGCASYFNSFIAGLGIDIPKALSGAFNPAQGTYVNLTAILIVLFIYFLLGRGVQASIRLNNIMVYLKIAIILLFVIVGAFFVKPANWNPYMPFGIKG